MEKSICMLNNQMCTYLRIMRTAYVCSIAIYSHNKEMQLWIRKFRKIQLYAILNELFLTEDTT